MQPNATNSGSSTKDESQLVTFLLKDEEFGFDIMSVQEIIRTPKMAKVPRTPPYVDGVANLRGVVLPIIDMRARFGMERAEETDRTRVLVIDINGTKTGLRVDRVKQVMRVSRGEIEPPPAAIRNTSTDYLDGVVKLDNGQRIIIALNAARVCHTEVERDVKGGETGAGTASVLDSRRSAAANGELSTDDAQQMVSFRIAREEYAFPMERVREILRVQTPKQIPDSPDYVLGVLTVRGQILPIIDLRKLLQQASLAGEHCSRCREMRDDYAGWVERFKQRFAANAATNVDLSATDRLRDWVANFSSSNQVLMETLSDIRARNEKLVKLAQSLGQSERQDPGNALADAGAEVVDLLCRLEQDIAANIQEDQRIIVVDANGVLLGLVVDHVNEVLNIPRSSMDPPPALAGSDGLELSGIAKLDDGNRLILLLDVGRLMQDSSLRQINEAQQAESAGEENRVQAAQAHEELQLVTFMLGGEEYGVPISQIQEIDRVSRITKIPKVASYVEGVTNLRGEVIPVVDSRRRFDLGAKAADDRTRVIIVDLAGVKTGLIVDSVREVLSIARHDIAPPPAAIAAGVGRQFISGIGKVDGGKRMIVLLDVEKILASSEKAGL